MTLEAALLTAISAVTSALIFVCRLLWAKVTECETDRRALRDEIEDVKTEVGELRGTQKAYDRCPQPACPFRPDRKVT